MKTAVFFFLTFLGLAAMNTAQAQSMPAPVGRTRKAEIKTSAVCEMCKATIEKAMFRVKGVKMSSLNVDTKMLTVIYDSKLTTLDKIRTAINNVGYDADESPATPEAYENLHSCCKKDSHP